MHYGLTQKPTLTENTCLVLGMLSDEIPDFAAILPTEYDEIINRLAQKLNEPGDTIWQFEVQGQSLLIIHCGKKGEFTTDVLEKRLTETVNLLLKQRITEATICMPPVRDLSADAQLEHMILSVDYQLYQFLNCKTIKVKAHTLENVEFCLMDAHIKTVQEAAAIAEGIRFTRDLANMPANICTPTFLADQAVELQNKHKSIQTQIISTEDMRQMGMGALLAVAQGSIQPPKLVEIHYNNAPDNTPPIVLVGKGITFDAGGISLKPAAGMEEMKFDMAGAASVLGTIKTCALLDLPLHVIGLLPCAENLPGGTAVKPGDVITSMSGQTIEITNTDAEGRLVLADALTYAERFNPELVVDIATLTGAIIVALGYERTGFMTEDDKLAEALQVAATASRDKIWRMPLEEAYLEAMESPVADLANASSDRAAGSVTAACFLSRFTEKYRWAHLDIAGTAWISGKKRTATGRPVPLLTQLLRNIVHAR